MYIYIYLYIHVCKAMKCPTFRQTLQQEGNVGGHLYFIMPMLRGCNFDFGAAMGSYEEKTMKKKQ